MNCGECKGIIVIVTIAIKTPTSVVMTSFKEKN